MTRPPPIASVIVPAHNEERGIARLLAQLITDDDRARVEVVVVCNGCTDRTAAVAAGFGPDVQVIDLPTPSKREALRVGDRAATAFPRVYVDGDVEISAASVGKLAAAVTGGSKLAAGPERIIPRDEVRLLVRWYYDVWERLPTVRAGLFGRGVIALAEAGNQRIRDLPPMMSDDLVMSEAFAPSERVVVPGATVVVRPPRTMADLIRRRVRAGTGNVQAQAAELRSPESQTSVRMLLSLARREPRLLPRLPVFVAVTLVAKLATRRAVRAGDFETWLRDESSRT